MLRAAVMTTLLLGLSAADAQDALRVDYAEVQITPLTFETSLAGSIQARDSVDIGFRQGGRIIEMLVKEGDHVTKGQPLAHTDPIQQEQSLMVAKARLLSATATRDQSLQARDRAEALLKAGVGTRAGLDDATQALSQAEGALAQAQTELDSAQRAVADTTLRASSDAIVTARNGEVGQIVSAAQSVISLATTSGLEAVFQTPDLPILNDAIGVKVSLKGIDAHVPDMTGTVQEISPLVDPHTGAVTVRAEIDDAPTDITLLGAAVRGTVHFPAGTGIAVPWTALTSSGGSPAVWLIDDDMTVRLAPIQIKRFTTDSVVIASGVKPGDRVVSAGSQLVYPGRKVIAQKVSP